MDHKIRILIIEDEALIAENLKLSLEDLGYEVTGTCYNYKEAVAAIRMDTADLIMLDINLGANAQENGLVLAAMIAGEFKKPFVFLTAYNDLDTIRQATKMQPSGYLIKPVNNAILFAAIQTAIEHFSAPEKNFAAADKQVQPDYFFVKLGARTHKLFWEDVYCIEAGKNYVKLRSVATKLDYPIRGSLTYVMESLVPKEIEPSFIRVNRALSLNRKFITSYDQDYIYCGGEKYENGKAAIKQLQELILK